MLMLQTRCAEDVPNNRAEDATAMFAGCDPLMPDEPDDPVTQATERRLWRLVLAALETGACYARGELAADPLAWFSSPSDLFDGATAFEACRELHHLERTMLLHGLGIGRNANPTAMDRLGQAPPSASSRGRGRSGGPPILSVVRGGHRPQGPRVWSSSADAPVDGGRMQVFWAMIATDVRAVRAHIRTLYGCRAVRQFRITPGFDWSEPLATALVSEAVAHTLMLAAADPCSAFATGLDVRIEQRFRE